MAPPGGHVLGRSWHTVWAKIHSQLLLSHRSCLSCLVKVWTQLRRTQRPRKTISHKAGICTPLGSQPRLTGNAAQHRNQQTEGNSRVPRPLPIRKELGLDCHKRTVFICLSASPTAANTQEIVHLFSFLEGLFMGGGLLASWLSS